MALSFSYEVKKEICKTPVGKACCRTAELYGILLYANTFSYHEIKIITANPYLKKRVMQLLKRVLNLEILPEEREKFIFSIADQRVIRQIFDLLGYDFKPHVAYGLNRNIIEEECCKAAFLRGAFLLAGTVAAPDKKCHFEIATSHQSLTRQVMALMMDMGFLPKLTERKGSAVIYFKDTASVENILTLLGAPVGAMSIMEAKVEKGLRNEINRRVNCETANLIKTTDAAAKQIVWIKKAINKYGMALFPESLRATVELRLANPSASLAELAMLSEEPITRSGLSHRLKKILSIVKQNEDRL